MGLGVRVLGASGVYGFGGFRGMGFWTYDRGLSKTFVIVEPTRTA